MPKPAPPINPRRKLLKMPTPICNKAQALTWGQKLQTRSRDQIHRHWLFLRAKSSSHHSNGAFKEVLNSSISRKCLEISHLIHPEIWASAWKISSPFSLCIIKTEPAPSSTQAIWLLHRDLPLRNPSRRKAWPHTTISNISNISQPPTRIPTQTPWARSLLQSCL